MGILYRFTPLIRLKDKANIKTWFSAGGKNPSFHPDLEKRKQFFGGSSAHTDLWSEVPKACSSVPWCCIAHSQGHHGMSPIALPTGFLRHFILDSRRSLVVWVPPSWIAQHFAVEQERLQGHCDHSKFGNHSYWP